MGKKSLDIGEEEDDSEDGVPCLAGGARHGGADEACKGVVSTSGCNCEGGGTGSRGNHIKLMDRCVVLREALETFSHRSWSLSYDLVGDAGAECETRISFSCEAAEAYM